MPELTDKWNSAIEYMRYVAAYLEHTEPEVFQEAGVAITELQQIFERQRAEIERLFGTVRGEGQRK